MDIADWREKIDELDRRLVELLSERARAAVEIGRLKRDTNLPIYEPQRERVVFENVQKINRGPLPAQDLVRIFERIMDVMRNIQKEGIGTTAEIAETETELDSEVNDYDFAYGALVRRWRMDGCGENRKDSSLRSE